MVLTSRLSFSWKRLSLAESLKSLPRQPIHCLACSGTEMIQSEYFKSRKTQLLLHYSLSLYSHQNSINFFTQYLCRYTQSAYKDIARIKFIWMRQLQQDLSLNRIACPLHCELKVYGPCLYAKSELHIKRGIEDNSKVSFPISE